MVFTGIIKHISDAIWNSKNQYISINITNKIFWENISIGESVAINGICLTVIKITSDQIIFFVQQETLKLTTLGLLTDNQLIKVNIERSLLYGDRYSGHIVSGHVNNIGKIIDIIYKDDKSLDMWIESNFLAPIQLIPIMKGSITLNGVSLTISNIKNNGLQICVSLIPFTLENTILHLLKIGDHVNIEWDSHNHINNDHNHINNDYNNYSDESWMLEARKLAALGEKTCAPNPAVGCILVYNNKIIGKGWHKKAGEGHAEVLAIIDAIQNRYPDLKYDEIYNSIQSSNKYSHVVSKCTMYVTLEPCIMFNGKKTPSCAELIIRMGIPYIIIGKLDFNNKVKNQGFNLLKNAGISVELLRPRVILKCAHSLNGIWTTNNNEWITSSGQREHAHKYLRAKNDAILIGSGTALADSPSLTARHGGKQPLRVLIDKRGRVPAIGPLFSTTIAKLLIITSNKGLHIRKDEWLNTGAEIEIVNTDSINEILQILAKYNITSVLVEGGLELQSAFIRENLVDELVEYIGGYSVSGLKKWNLPANKEWKCIDTQIIDNGVLLKWIPHINNDYKNNVYNAINEIRKGNLVVISDDQSREDEADLVGNAATITPDNINFMLKHTSGILCAPMSKTKAVNLELPLMIEYPNDPMSTSFTVSCDAVGSGTGVSANSRALTFNKLASSSSIPADFVKPGHVFPLISTYGGVHERGGHTEATIDLLKLAGIYDPVGVIGEIVGKDNNMLKSGESIKFAEEYGLVCITTEQLRSIVPRKIMTTRVSAICKLPIKGYGEYDGQCWYDEQSEHEIIVLTKGKVEQNCLVRIHSCCFTGDILGSERCDCGLQLEKSFKIINDMGNGIILYERSHEGRGIGLASKFDAYSLMDMDKSIDTYTANNRLGYADDIRDFSAAARILKQLGLFNIKLISNNPNKIKSLEEHGISIIETIPIHINNISDTATKYISDKIQIGKHIPIKPHTNKILTIVKASWHVEYIDMLAKDVINEWNKNGGASVNIVNVSGAWELPLAAKRACSNSDAVIAIGILLKGKTMHFEYISQGVAFGLMKVGLETNKPVINGVLNILNTEQAADRANSDSGIAKSWVAAINY